jgi:hypothetical protein
MCWKETGIDGSNDKPVTSLKDEENSSDLPMRGSLVTPPRVKDQRLYSRLNKDTTNQSFRLYPLPISHHMESQSEDYRGSAGVRPFSLDCFSGLPLHIPTDDSPHFQRPQPDLYDWQYCNRGCDTNHLMTHSHQLAPSRPFTKGRPLLQAMQQNNVNPP